MSVLVHILLYVGRRRELDGKYDVPLSVLQSVVKLREK